MNEPTENPYQASPLEPNAGAVNDPATRPLSNAGRAFAFFGGSIGCGLISLVIAIRATVRFKRRGETKKALDVWIWFGLGLLAMIALLCLVSLLERENPGRLDR